MRYLLFGIMSYCGDVTFSVNSFTATVAAPLVFIADGGSAKRTVHVSSLYSPCVGVRFLVKFLWQKRKCSMRVQQMMPEVPFGLACVVGGVVSSQGSKFFQSGVVIFVAVLLHNGLGYLLGYGAGKLVGMNTSKKRTIAIEVGMQNAGLATNLTTTTAQFASTPSQQSSVLYLVHGTPSPVLC